MTLLNVYLEKADDKSEKVSATVTINQKEYDMYEELEDALKSDLRRHGWISIFDKIRKQPAGTVLNKIKTEIKAGEKKLTLNSASRSLLEHLKTNSPKGLRYHEIRNFYLDLIGSKEKDTMAAQYMLFVILPLYCKRNSGKRWQLRNIGIAIPSEPLNKKWWIESGFKDGYEDYRKEFRLTKGVEDRKQDDEEFEYDDKFEDKLIAAFDKAIEEFPEDEISDKQASEILDKLIKYVKKEKISDLDELDITDFILKT